MLVLHADLTETFAGAARLLTRMPGWPGHDEGPTEQARPGYISRMKIAAALVLLAAALAKAVAASDGRYWLKVRGAHNANAPTDEELKTLEGRAEKIVDRANLIAYVLGVLAAVLALYALD